MQHSPKREGPYLLRRVAKKARKEKAQKKSKVKCAVKEGSKLLPRSIPNCPIQQSHHAATDVCAAKAFEKGCKAFNDEIHAGKLVFFPTAGPRLVTYR